MQLVIRNEEVSNAVCPTVQKQLHFFSIPSGRGNTLLDYDLIPRFLHDRAQKKIPLSEQDPNSLRVIKINDSESYEIIPAILNIVDKKSSEQGRLVKYAIYPGTRESLIEDCLIHFAQFGEFSLEKGAPGYRTDGVSVGVCFTLYQLRSELKKRGKEYKLEELKEGLDVLAMANYKYINSDNREKVCGYIVAELDSIPNPDPNDRIRSDRIMHVIFDGRASKRILAGHYRSYDAVCSLSMRSPIARYLYKQFTHHWQHANNKGQSGSYRSVDQNETIIASGCPLLSNPTKRRDNVRKALDELVSVGVIQPLDDMCDIVLVKVGRKIVDVRFMVRPTESFISQQITGYKQLQKAKFYGKSVSESHLRKTLHICQN
jgi:hypothetical protein